MNEEEKPEPCSEETSPEQEAQEERGYGMENDGVGSTPYVLFRNSSLSGFRQADIDNGTCACTVVANNAVGKGNKGDRLFGKVVWVSSTEFWTDLDIPKVCSVQLKGVATLRSESLKSHSQLVVLDGKGGLIPFGQKASWLHKARMGILAIEVELKRLSFWLG